MIRVAVATDHDMVASHFGRCQGYTVATVDGGLLSDLGFVQNPGHEPGLLPRLLAEHGVRQVVAGGFGQRAQRLFEQSGISCITGVRGAVQDALAAYASGSLVSGASLCDHESQRGR